jgi:hypothetical protein
MELDLASSCLAAGSSIPTLLMRVLFKTLLFSTAQHEEGTGKLLETLLTKHNPQKG